MQTFISVAIAVTAVLGMWMLVRMSASFRRDQVADAGCGYCGTSNDPENACERCWASFQEDRDQFVSLDIPTGDHWR